MGRGFDRSRSCGNVSSNEACERAQAKVAQLRGRAGICQVQAEVARRLHAAGAQQGQLADIARQRPADAERGGEVQRIQQAARRAVPDDAGQHDGKRLPRGKAAEVRPGRDLGQGDIQNRGFSRSRRPVICPADSTLTVNTGAARVPSTGGSAR